MAPNPLRIDMIADVCRISIRTKLIKIKWLSGVRAARRTGEASPRSY